MKGSWARRDLLGLLVRRDLRARYQGSYLGALWSLARPIAMLIIYYVAIGKFLGAERSIPSIAVYIFCGLTIWTLFIEIITGTTGSIVANGALIKKVYVQREVFPLAAVGAAWFNFLVQFVVLLAFTLIIGEPPTLSAIWLVPMAAIMITVFAFAIGLLLAAVNVYLRDVQQIVEIALQFMFWASPIVYSYALVHQALAGGWEWLEQLLLANPVTMAVLSFQQGMWSAGVGQPYPADLLIRIAIVFVVSLGLLWGFQRVFARLEGNFAQEL